MIDNLFNFVGYNSRSRLMYDFIKNIRIFAKENDIMIVIINSLKKTKTDETTYYTIKESEALEEFINTEILLTKTNNNRLIFSVIKPFECLFKSYTDLIDYSNLKIIN